MARTALALQVISELGTVPSYTAANVDGHFVAVPAILHVKNGGGGSINVTVQTYKSVEGRAIADDVIAVGAGAEKMIKLNSRDLLVRASGETDAGFAYVDFSGVTTVTVALVT